MIFEVTGNRVEDIILLISNNIMNKNNLWDKLSSKFDIHKTDDEIDPGAADNILVAWPPIINLIENHFHAITRLKALDYGCGTGGFTNKLFSLGFNVVGTDSSESMLNIARQSLGNKISFINTSELEGEKYDLISAIMVLQFVEDIDELFKNLVENLKDNGLIVFAVFNPEFVSRCLKVDKLFSHFDSNDNPKLGVIDFGEGINITTYVRNAEEYDTIMKKLGLTKRMEAYPEFIKEYLDKYPTDTPTDVSEYLILGYSK